MNRGDNVVFGSVSVVVLLAVLWYAWNDDDFGKNRDLEERGATDSLINPYRELRNVYIPPSIPYQSSDSSGFDDALDREFVRAVFTARGSLAKYEATWTDGRLHYVIPADSIEVTP